MYVVATPAAVRAGWTCDQCGQSFPAGRSHGHGSGHHPDYPMPNADGVIVRGGFTRGAR